MSILSAFRFSVLFIFPPLSLLFLNLWDSIMAFCVAFFFSSCATASILWRFLGDRSQFCFVSFGVLGIVYNFALFLLVFWGSYGFLLFGRRILLCFFCFFFGSYGGLLFGRGDLLFVLWNLVSLNLSS